MQREGYDKIVSDVVSRALGAHVKLTGQGRTSDSRHCFVRPQKSECELCSVHFLKKHVDSEYSMPCEVEERPYCRVRRLATAITAFGSAQAVEERIEMALRGMGISSEVSLGRGNAHNMSIVIKIDDAGRARMAELKAAAKRARDEQRSASTLAQALDILSPTAPR
jgi:hypothetical protein